MKHLILSITSILYFVSVTLAQKAPPQNWFNLDAKSDKFPGVSTNKAYEKLLTGKQVKPVVVAVIDGGTDFSHIDLKENIWVNEKEVAENGIDDDKNGYADDMHGWSFIGGKDSDVVEDTYEITRVYAMMQVKYAKADTVKMNLKEKKEYYEYLEIKKSYQKSYQESKKLSESMEYVLEAIGEIKLALKTENPSAEQLKKFEPEKPMQEFVKENVLKLMAKGMSYSDFEDQVKGGYEHYNKGAKYSFNTNFNARSRVGDNSNDQTECCYGNTHISGPKGEHGTHVAGIIGAIRNNQTGMDGVAAPVKIMVLRVVPDGDERDKDVANAIRYAADNGAKVINMSFGKGYSPYKEVVDAAVKYAESKDVLLVHGSGNDGKNTDIENNFPNDFIQSTATYASNWIEVGASSWESGKKIAADFSNYGQKNVDVFAPGVSIYSTLPGNTYGTYNGTSMASPVTAGVAALVRAYYPTLNAAQVKDIIVQSVVKVKGKVILPGSAKTKVKMSSLCNSGGIVNAYNALVLAEKVAAVK